MRLPVSDQLQPWPYLAPFSHNTSVTYGQMDGHTTTRAKNPRQKLIGCQFLTNPAY